MKSTSYGSVLGSFTKKN